MKSGNLRLFTGIGEPKSQIIGELQQERMEKLMLESIRNFVNISLILEILGEEDLSLVFTDMGEDLKSIFEYVRSGGQK